MSKDRRIQTDSSEVLSQNPFGNLNLGPLPSAPPPPVASATSTPAKNRGRVDIRLEKAGRGGKEVTVIYNFVGIGLPEKEQLCKKIKNLAGTGGTVKDGRIEIQGDQRTKAQTILQEAGFKPVLSGG